MAVATASSETTRRSGRRSRRAAPRWAAGGRGARGRARWPGTVSSAVVAEAAAELARGRARRSVRDGVDEHVARRGAGRRTGRPGGRGWRPGRSGRRARSTGSRVRIGAVVDPAEGDDRGAHALGAEAREGLGVAALVEGGHRQQLGRRRPRPGRPGRGSGRKRPARPGRRAPARAGRIQTLWHTLWHRVDLSPCVLGAGLAVVPPASPPTQLRYGRTSHRGPWALPSPGGRP